MNQIEQEINNWAVMSVKGSSLTNLLDAFYSGNFSPIRDYLLELLDEGSPDYLLTLSGVWRGTLAEWLEVGPGLVRRVPVGRVELVDREPYEINSRLIWHFCDTCGRSDRLPNDWDVKEQRSSVFYDTPELALADASRRAILWARGEATKETA